MSKNNNFIFRYKLPENVSNSAREFIDSCLTKNYQQRPTASDLIHHPFLCDFHHHHHEQQPIKFLTWEEFDLLI
jgi:serine/threonine protein kinase